MFAALAAALATGAQRVSSVPAITVDYPAEGALFPPDIASPTVLWHDPVPAAKVWRIEVTFGDRLPPIAVISNGKPRALGEIDQRCAKAGAVTPVLTAYEAEGHSWKPAPDIWEEIKKRSVKKPATLSISGLSDDKSSDALSRGLVTIQTSKDPVGAPIFYRDVPLIALPTGERGVIMPLPAGAVPLIAWRLLHVGEPRSKLMMEGLPTCVNCHSFSRDGGMLGIDVDGPQNDKGLYGLVHVKQETSIRSEDVIRWSSFSEERATKRFGFMSQISPDGRFVVTSIEDPGTHRRGVDSRLFNGFYNDYGFGQVFFPTRGVLAWYSRATGKLQVLPGADDPKYVQACAFWSPDSKYLVFSRAEAKDPYHEGQPIALHANDPEETQIQYDLYRIPFNEGKGGKPEPVVGASQNGYSNNFPKVSPDGKWIVFVRNRNGLLMRPDSELYIVPFKGGQARRLKCNTARMNSWHSFSPNGRWLVFASKGRALYTQMYLTHIDKDGNDSPAILIENATAANRAVNIPEFVNAAPGALTKMDAPATEFYRLCDSAIELANKKDYAAAIAEWSKALQLDAADAKAHYGLALALHNQGQLPAAVAEYRKSLDLDPENATTHTNYGAALVAAGKLDDGMDQFSKALAIDPQAAGAHGNLGIALLEKGRTAEALEHCRKAVEIDPENAEAQNTLGFALARSGQLDEGAQHLIKAVAIAPESFEYRYNLGRVFAARGNFGLAVTQFEKAVDISKGREPLSLEMLAAMYSETGRPADAIRIVRRALEIATAQNDGDSVQRLNGKLARYQVQAGAK